MKKLFYLYFVIIIMFLNSFVIAKEQDTVIVGMNLTEATKIFKTYKLKQQDKLLSKILIDKSLKQTYFIIENDVFVSIQYNMKNKITSICLITLPEYRPVKGIETVKELESISINNNYYTCKFKRPSD